MFSPHSLTKAVLTALLFASVIESFGKSPPARPDRVALSRKFYEPTIKAAVENAGLQYPPNELFLRVFKFENALEVWARNDPDSPMALVVEFPLVDVRARGPKRAEGDRLTPEGCYRIVDFNPESAGYLSLRLNYPNLSDRIRGDHKKPGKDIFIHGGGYSTGCITVSFPEIAQLYLLALDTQRKPIQVHIFPHKLHLTAEEVASKPMTDANPKLLAFWTELRPIYDAFEESKTVPNVVITKEGRYVLEPKR